MLPLYFTTHENHRLVIIPDTEAHLNGHQIITYTYSIYADRGGNRADIARNKESKLHLSDNPDPDYYGYVTFEKPGSLFSYTADGKPELHPEEVNEIIEFISDVRDDGGWKKSSSQDETA